MKKATLVLLFCLQAVASFCQVSTGAAKLAIEVNYNVELLGLAYFIGFEGVNIEKDTVVINGLPMPKKEWHSYGFRLYEQYKKYAASEHLARSFAVADHLWLDYLINLLLQVEGFPGARLTPGIEVKHFIHFSQKGDSAEARQNATAFLDGLNQFHEEINFKQYIADTRQLYAAALDQVKAALPQANFIEAMEGFYRKRFDRYTLVPSLTIPKGMGFGLMYTKAGRTALYNVFGAFEQQRLQQPLDPGFSNPQRLRELSIHEFGHSFVNPEVDRLPPELIAKSERLYEPIKPAMTDQGYNTWTTCLYELFVRAGEVVIAGGMGDKESAQRLQAAYINDRRFIYLPTIIAALETYGKGQTTYHGAVQRAITELMKLPEATGR